MSALKLKFLSHGTLESRELEKTRRFYEECLGLEVVPCEGDPERLDRAGEVLGREGVHGVLHRVRCDDEGVVAVDERGIEAPLEGDVDGQVAESNEGNNWRAVTVTVP